MLKSSIWRSAISLAALILALMIVFVLPGLAEGIQPEESDDGAPLSENFQSEDSQPESSQSEVHTHEWTNTEYIVSEDGTMVSAHTSCTICKTSQDASATVQVTSVAPTCTAPGSIIKQVSFNPPLQNYYNMSESGEPPLGHNFGSPTYSMSSDYAEMTASRACQREGCNAVEQETVPAASRVISESTCETPGETEYTATFQSSIFGTHSISVFIPAKGHSMSKTEAHAATCEFPGNTEYYTCSACGKFFSDEAGTAEIAEGSWVLPAAGHTPVKAAAAAAACEASGNTEYYTCSACGKFFSDEACSTEIGKDSWIIPAVGHKPEKTAAVDPTCEASGNIEYYTCSVCGKHFSDEACTTETDKDSWILPPAGHTIVKVEAVPAACVTPGSSEYYTCSTCGRFFSGEAATDEQKIEENSWVIAPLGHAMQAHGAVAPTCTHTGHTAYWICSRCGGVYADQDGYTETTLENVRIPARGHQLKYIPGKDSTCTEQGYGEHYTCEDCGSIFMDKEAKTPLTQDDLLLPLAGHTGGTAICGHRAICKICGQKYGPAGDHPAVIDHVYSYKKESGNSKSYLIKYCSACETVISVEADPDAYYLAELMLDPNNITVIDLPDNAEFPDPESLKSEIPTACNEEISESVQPLTSAASVKYTVKLKADEASMFLEKTAPQPIP